MRYINALGRYAIYQIMLIFGASVGDWKEKAAYALDKADNEFAQVREIRCEGIDDVHTALAMMAAFAADTHCKLFIYHATINLFRGERLGGPQWMKAIDRLEKDLGLEGHYRIAFEHIKKDRQHYHIYWFRLPPGANGPAVNMGNDYYICEKTAIALEKEFGLKVAPRRDKSKPSHKKQEINDRNAKIRVDPDIVTRDVTRIFRDSTTTQSFVKNLAKEGYTLTRGKGKKLVLVDQKGGYHGLMRRIDGFRLGDVTRKFPALETMSLPKLGDVLKSRRPATKPGFRRASFVVGKRGRISAPKIYSPSFSHRPATKSLAAIIAEARRHHPKPEKKHYPAPIMRKRRKKIIENEPSRPIIDLRAIENAELLAWAWENCRVDILRQFGIIVPFDFFEP